MSTLKAKINSAGKKESAFTKMPENSYKIQFVTLALRAVGTNQCKS